MVQATARASSPRSASTRCPRPSGSARCSPSRATARWSATPAPGTSTTRTTCGSRCASRPTDEDFSTIHHELGHNFYQRAYNELPFLFQDSANDGFHEAIGDTIALSITPDVPEAARPARAACPTASKDVGLLMQRALDKVAFLPFGLLDRPVALEGLLRRDHPGRTTTRPGGSCERKYQGVAPPVARSETDFDPGRQVPRAGEHALHALLPRRHPAVPVPPRALQGGRPDGPAAPLLDLRQQGGRRAARDDAGDGRRASPGRRRSRRSPASSRWTPPRSSTTSRRSRPGSTEQNKGQKCGW